MFEEIPGGKLESALEALLFISDEPVGVLTLAQALGSEAADVQASLERLARELEEQERGIQLREVAGGWRLFTHPAYHDLLEAYVLSWDTRRMSQAALEVLAVVAYGQPMTRAEVSSIRGVNSDSAMNTLLERGFLREAGVQDAPGNPVLYGTSRAFLEHFGLKSCDELPPLEEFAPDEKTAALIRERLGAPALQPDMAQLAQEMQGELAGVVDKIDFDQLVFNTDDE